VPRRRTADGSEAQKSNRHAYPRPIAFADLTFLHRRSVTPTKINRGGREAANGTWARTGGNAGAEETIREESGSVGRVNRDAIPPVNGMKPAKGTDLKPQERRRATNEGRPASSGQATLRSHG
jgi:hypothetical protein